MNIALIVHDLHEHGGHSLYTKILAEGFSRDHEVTVFANRCERPRDAHWQTERVRAWRSSALATVQTFPLGLRSHADKLAAYQIQHAQGYCGGRPNVVTAHICAAAYLNSLRDINSRTRASLRLMAMAEERFFRRFDGEVIAISEKIARELRELYGFAGSITVIPHGVDAGRFNGDNRTRHRKDLRERLGIREHDVLALYAGDLTKAHSHLKKLAAAAPEVKFVIVTPSHRYQWRDANVQMLPPTSELQKYYAAADVFVFPSTYDAFGMVVLEAMAAGLPVITSNQAGAAELIEPSKDGYVLPLEQWVEGAADILKKQSSFGSIGEAAKNTVRRHTWPAVVSQVEKVYQRALNL
ncbi:MAG TPA: glycosyltransferase family 4 protein [Pyrinomonadaceae bacterium]|nr:glycosyltransferase family 4 protein [Pyrinomonadaceae bacterium]